MPASRPAIVQLRRKVVSIVLAHALQPTLSLAALPFLLTAAACAADLDDCRRLLVRGKFEECIAVSEAALEKRAYGDDWYVVKARAELATGRYRDAKQTVDAGLKRYSRSIAVRLVGHDACLHNGEIERAGQLLREIDDLANRSPWRYTGADDLVTLGRAALLLGGDARHVLVDLFDRARQAEPDNRAAYLAAGRLALEKNDDELAADLFQEALKKFPEDPDVHFGLARAFAAIDEKRSLHELRKTLKLNPRHVPAMLFKVDRLIDSEQFEAAETEIAGVLKINPRHPRAWAYRAVLAHLENDPRGETLFRDKAQGRWKRNPAVEHLIGKKLSQKYRFAEGAAYQRRALRFDPNYLPARVQLSQDLLRLGHEEEGWRLASAAHRDDGYEVVTFNLLELRDRIDRFRTLENDDFVVRMNAHEAAVYGPRVLELLGRAKQTLCRKYDLQLDQKVTVEIFPDANDFAVRTFGMPAVSGYLGVCFGRVITANSPASQAGHPSNWEAVLWHEFCHVVTLELTRNKMPRWLSEGISVYEERQENPTWGQRMTPQYRRMVLGGELTPIAELSSAFLSPESPLHLQFAYYESSLVVEFLIDRYGLDALKHVLHDLAAGLPVNVALDRRAAPVPKLEQEFAAFARRRAEQLGPNVDWSQPDVASILNDDGDLLTPMLQKLPNNFVLLSLAARQHIDDQEWERAKAPLEQLIELCPSHADAYEMLAKVYRELGDSKRERAVLQDLAARDADALAACLRLIELSAADQDWPAAREYARRALAVNPLIAQPHRALAEAAENLGRPNEAIGAYRTLLAMQPDDPAEIHYRLARLLHGRGDPAAKRHVLAALEEAPRFRAAHRLLLRIARGPESPRHQKERVGVRPAAKR